MDDSTDSLPRSVVGQSPAEYTDAKGIRSSLLKQILITPAHYQFALQHPKETTAAMSLGTALHAALLEPAAFDAAFAVVPKVDRRTRDGKDQ